MRFIVYTTATGVIVRTGDCPAADLAGQAQSGQTAVAGDADDSLHYMLAGVVTNRPFLSGVAIWNKTTVTANGTDTATFGAGLPNPTSVTVQVPAGVTPIIAPEVVTGGTFSFATPVPGSYTLLMQGPGQYQPYSQVIIAT